MYVDYDIMKKLATWYLHGVQHPLLVGVALTFAYVAAEPFPKK